MLSFINLRRHIVDLFIILISLFISKLEVHNVCQDLTCKPMWEINLEKTGNNVLMGIDW